MSDAALESAFRATRYRVFTTDFPDFFDLRIGVRQPAFDDFLKRQGVSRWAIVTPYNPGAMRLSDTDNQARQIRFLARIGERGWTCLKACNCADAGHWPLEPARFLLQVDEENMRALAAEFGQLAFIFGDSLDDSAPRLVWTN